MSEKIEIGGRVAPGFENVMDVFASNWAEDIEVGASLSVVLEGETIVDLWGGWRDRERSQPWTEDTLVNVYSTTKGMGSTAMAVLAADGKMDFDAPAITYWPEFGTHGKDVLSVGQVMSHQSGLNGWHETMQISDLYDWEKATGYLAAQEPFWEPGKGVAYHAVTWGYLVGEIFRRAAGQTLGEFFRERVSGPLDADFWIGLPESEEDRVAIMIGPNHAVAPMDLDIDEAALAFAKKNQGHELAMKSAVNPIIRPFQHVSTREWRAAEIAAANGTANARGIARVYGALANGGELEGTRIISPEGIAEATKVEWEGPALTPGPEVTWLRGFSRNRSLLSGPNPMTFGHGGAGGSAGFADPDARLGFGYAMNQMAGVPVKKSRAGKLINEVYSCLQQGG